MSELMIYKRNFLKGLAASVVTLSTGTSISFLPPPQKVIGFEVGWLNQWLKDIMPINEDFANNVMLYGIGVLREKAEYPFIESVHPSQIMKAA